MPYLCVLIYFVFFAAVAMTVAEGLWNNTLTLLAIAICGPLAIALGYPLGLLLQEKIDKPVEQTWYFVFAGVWLVFFVSMLIVRLLLDRVASKSRMKFIPPLEAAAGPLMGLVVAVIFTSFLTFTLYTIPIAAGEWKIGEAADWQKTTMQSGSGPFNSVLRAMAGEKVAKYHIQ
jgi:drug/metabolite transporter (DMT)-like permease